MKIAELIPQVFYDAIARITSGIILLVSIGLLWYDKLSTVSGVYAESVIEAFTKVSLLTLVMAYVLAFLIEGIRIILFEPISIFFIRIMPTWFQRLTEAEKRRSIQWDETLEDFFKASPSCAGMEFQRPSEAIAIDVLRLKNPEAGSRIVKLRSEVALCKTLCAGWTAMLLFYLYHCITQYRNPIVNSEHSLFRSYPALVLLAGIVAVGSRAITINNRHFRALYNHWLLLVNPGFLPFSDRRDERFSISPKTPPILLIPMDSVREDPQLKDRVRGSRKIAVTEIYEGKEIPATETLWKAPEEGRPCPVLPTRNLEVGVFTQFARQSCHIHKIATEMYSVLDGEMEIESADKTYVMKAGDMIIVNPGTSHRVLNTKQPFLCRVITANCYGKSDKYVE